VPAKGDVSLPQGPGGPQVGIKKKTEVIKTKRVRDVKEAPIRGDPIEGEKKRTYLDLQEPTLRSGCSFQLAGRIPDDRRSFGGGSEMRSIL